MTIVSLEDFLRIVSCSSNSFYIFLMCFIVCWDDPFFLIFIFVSSPSSSVILSSKTYSCEISGQLDFIFFYGRLKTGLDLQIPSSVRTQTNICFIFLYISRLRFILTLPQSYPFNHSFSSNETLLSS